MIWPVGRIFLEPGDDQRHGAAPNRFMTLIAMLDLDDRGNPPPGANAASRFVEGHERQASLANRPHADDALGVRGDAAAQLAI